MQFRKFIPKHQIFDSSVNVTFVSGAVSYVLPEWFGSGNGNIGFTSGNITPLSKVYIDGTSNYIDTTSSNLTSGGHSASTGASASASDVPVP